MSQAGPLNSQGVVEPAILTLTGNSGGAIGPDGSGNIDIFGSNVTGINIIGTPASNLLTVLALQATTAQQGTVLLATNAQTIAGTDANNAVTSASLAAKLGTQTAHSLAVFEGTSSALTALGAATNGQLPIGSTGTDPVLATLSAGTGITITNGAGSITIATSGLTTLNYTTVNHAATPYTVTATDDYLGVDISGGVVSLLFPNAPSTGRVFYVKDKAGAAATSNISVTTVGGVVTIDGSTTYTMNVNFQAISLIFNGASYEVF